MRKLIFIFPLFLLISCSEKTYESRELPTKYSDTPTHGSAYDITEELNKN
jgi:hypothetical protein